MLMTGRSWRKRKKSSFMTYRRADADVRAQLHRWTLKEQNTPPVAGVLFVIVP